MTRIGVLFVYEREEYLPRHQTREERTNQKRQVDVGEVDSCPKKNEVGRAESVRSELLYTGRRSGVAVVGKPTKFP